MVFDGMDWQTTWAAAIHNAGEVKYREGRGTGLHFQDYRGCRNRLRILCDFSVLRRIKCRCECSKSESTGKEIYGGYSAKLVGRFLGPLKPMLNTRLVKELLSILIRTPQPRQHR